MTDEYWNNLAVVRNKLNRRELLEQLAEEATELAQASLKAIRAEGLSNNPTPISAVEATRELLGEIADISNCLTALSLNAQQVAIDIIAEQKMQRWVDRVLEVKNK